MKPAQGRWLVIYRTMCNTFMQLVYVLRTFPTEKCITSQCRRYLLTCVFSFQYVTYFTVYARFPYIAQQDYTWPNSQLNFGRITICVFLEIFANGFLSSKTCFETRKTTHCRTVFSIFAEYNVVIRRVTKLFHYFTIVRRHSVFTVCLQNEK